MLVRETLCPHCKGVVFSQMTEAQQAEAVSRYKAGATAKEIAWAFNRDEGTIRRLMRRNGVRKRRKTSCQ